MIQANAKACTDQWIDATTAMRKPRATSPATCRTVYPSADAGAAVERRYRNNAMARKLRIKSNSRFNTQSLPKPSPNELKILAAVNGQIKEARGLQALL